MPEKLKGYLGLAVRAGQAALGSSLALRDIRDGRAAVVLIDEGASENTRKKLGDACAFRRVPCLTVPSGWIGESCGKSDRMAVSVRRGGLADSIIRLAGGTEDTRQ